MNILGRHGSAYNNPLEPIVLAKEVRCSDLPSGDQNFTFLVRRAVWLEVPSGTTWSGQGNICLYKEDDSLKEEGGKSDFIDSNTCLIFIFPDISLFIQLQITLKNWCLHKEQLDVPRRSQDIVLKKKICFNTLEILIGKLPEYIIQSLDYITSLQPCSQSNNYQIICHNMGEGLGKGGRGKWMPFSAHGSEAEWPGATSNHTFPKFWKCPPKRLCPFVWDL